jgi:hypothetical protein
MINTLLHIIIASPTTLSPWRRVNLHCKCSVRFCIMNVKWPIYTCLHQYIVTDTNFIDIFNKARGENFFLHFLKYIFIKYILKYTFVINITFIQYEGGTEVNETQKWTTSKKRLRTTVLDEKFHFWTWGSHRVIGEFCHLVFDAL